jgi:hypothetical protein
MLSTESLKKKPNGSSFCGISTCDLNTVSWISEHHHSQLRYVVNLTLVNPIILWLFYKGIISGTKFSNKSCPVQHKIWIVIIIHVCLRSLYNFTHLSYHFVFVSKVDNPTGYYDVTLNCTVPTLRASCSR